MNDRWEEQYPGDSTIVTEGDSQIIGMNARIQPEKLPEGIAQYLQNQRLDTFTPTTRKGTAKQTNAIAPTSVPLNVPFIVGSSAIVVDTITDGIFTSCIFSDQNNKNANYIFCATGAKVYSFSPTSQAVTTINYPSNELVEAVDNSTSMFQFGGKVYLLRGDLGITIGTSVSSLTSSGTTATLTTTTATGLNTNNYVRISGATPSSYNGDYQITSTGASAFTYQFSGSTSGTASGTITVNRLKTPLVWNGSFSSSFTLTNYGVIAQNFFYMPVSNFGFLQQNRAILEYGRNQVIISQVTNAEAYDIINGIFTFGPGTSDYLVGLAPYQDTQTIVLNRQSVWLINGVAGDVAQMTTQLITAQVGCCSRYSIATCGANVLFLNERGVFMLQPGFELTLRGNSLPLSADIDPIIQTINFAALNAPWAAYFLNRYYLAVPLNGSTRNNTVLVYNFINEKWESVDTFPMNFYCDELQVALNNSGKPTLYAISYDGGVYAYEQNETDDFAAASSTAMQYTIQGEFQTRRFTFGTPQLKRFNRMIVNVNMDASASLQTTVNTFNPEDSRTMPIISNTGTTSQQQTRPYMIGKKGYAMEIVFSNVSTRVSVQDYTISAYLKGMKSTGTT